MQNRLLTMAASLAILNNVLALPASNDAVLQPRQEVVPQWPPGTLFPFGYSAETCDINVNHVVNGPIVASTNDGPRKRDIINYTPADNSALQKRGCGISKLGGGEAPIIGETAIPCKAVWLGYAAKVAKNVVDAASLNTQDAMTIIATWSFEYAVRKVVLYRDRKAIDSIEPNEAYGFWSGLQFDARTPYHLHFIFDKTVQMGRGAIAVYDVTQRKIGC